VACAACGIARSLLASSFPSIPGNFFNAAAWPKILSVGYFTKEKKFMMEKVHVHVQVANKIENSIILFMAMTLHYWRDAA
jgi:hypothetical protein